MPTGHPCLEVFARCVTALQTRKLIRRESRQDKEFHFQIWFKARLGETGLNFEVGGRNTYPDFRLVASANGFEVKGLAYPGREANYDCNSQVPSGSHNGRTIFYMVAPSSTSSVGIRLNLTATHIRCSTLWFAMAISSTPITTTFTRTKA